MADITFSSEDNYDEEFEGAETDSDDEYKREKCLKSVHPLQDKYKMFLKECKEDGVSKITRSIVATVKNEANEAIGSITAYLLNRRDGTNKEFWAECDGLNQESFDVAMMFTTQGGRLNYNKITGLNRDTDNLASSKGGFLVVYEVKVVEKERGHDLSLDMVESLLDHLGQRWTIAWILPGSLEAGNKSEDEIDAGNIVLARHWARLGFVQASTQEDSCYFWYLVPERRTRKSKEEVRNLPVVVTSCTRETADENQNVLVKAILAASNPATSDELKKITKLVKDGQDINKTEALFFGILNNKVVVVRHLLELGADVQYKNQDGKTPLLQAASSHFEPRYRIQNFQNDHFFYSPLHKAASQLNVEIFQLLLKFGADKEVTDSKGKTPFDNAVGEIEKITQARAVHHNHTKRVMKFEERCDKLVILHLLIKDPSKLIGGILTPRMFYRLKITAQESANVCEESMPHFEKRIPISRSAVFKDFVDGDSCIHLLDKVPIYEVPKKIVKSYAWGWQQQLKAIGDVMDRGLLPTESRILEELSCSDWRYNSFYRENGGCILHGLVAIVEAARDLSQTEGNREFEEVHGETLEDIPAMEALDDDFHFVHHFLVSYCVTPGVTIAVPDIQISPSAPQQSTHSYPTAGPSGVKKAKGTKIFASTAAVATCETPAKKAKQKSSPR